MRLAAALVFLIATTGAVSGCGADASGNEPVSLASVSEPLPVPTGEVVLTITGADQPNVGDEVRVDLEGIESLGLETSVVHEPFVERDLEFSGVDVDSVLAAAGIGPDSPLTWRALDDYEVEFTRAQLAAENAMLATRVDGAPIEIADGGPIRIVFLDPDGPLARDTNQWIWSVTGVEVG